jgi:ABC-2 type transport system ATP-binding protein
MNMAAETTALGKRYRRTWALRDCSLSVPAGRVTALVGPNGAGKTTLLSILAGLSAPTTGTVSVLGVPAGSPRSRLSVAFVAQDTPVYTDLRVRDHLRAARDLNHQWDQRLAGERLAGFGIPPGRKAGKLSGGQQAQLALTLALARRPGLLLLDEPLARLDPVARHDSSARSSLPATTRGSRWCSPRTSSRRWSGSPATSSCCPAAASR